MYPRTGLVKMGKIEEIHQTELIRAPIVDVFRAFTVSRIVDEWGGGPARIQARLNGKYSLWDGEMFGVIKEYEFPRLLGYTLREASWEKSCPDSYVVWHFEEGERGTCIDLLHTNLPTKKIREIHNDGWGEYFIGPLKAHLEYKKS